ncbi:PAS domain-containing sensor histidine kinase [Pedobacter xixiisoli]|uniref:histidine kinase n=1 Tax=Pedobacter xixiisoli TaxID=1476464 RepID=A0A285ZT64_9SPHI|nr:PAS domain-containing protein [Pedobacter xixiisoli]SOD12844.1 PAS domain S-box-containing protein [Pedobacter xixiisoli]
MDSNYSKNRFNDLIDAAPSATAIYHTRDIVVTAANAQMLAFWGKDETVIGKPLIEAVPELAGQPFIALLQKVYDTGITHHAERDGAELLVDGKLQISYFNYTYKAILGVNGKTEAIIHSAINVTPLVKAQQELSEMQERLSLALQSAEIGTWELAPVSEEVYWDQRCRALFGFEGEADINYHQVLDCIVAEDKQMVMDAVAAAVDPKRLANYDVRFRTLGTASKKIRWVHCKGRAYLNEMGVTYRFAGTARDITAEVNTSLNEQQMLSLVNYNADVMSIADMQGNLIYMNHAGKKLLGVEENTPMNSMTARDFYEPEELRRVQETIIPQIDDEKGWTGTLCLKNSKTHEAIPCQVNYILIKNPITGEIIGRGATARDLRPELKAKDKLAQAMQEMEFLANSVPTVVWTATTEGMIDFVNKQWYEQSAVAITDALGTGWTELVHPDDLERTLVAWKNSLTTGMPYQAEFRLKDKHEKYRWWLVRAVALKDNNHNILKWYGSNTDITEQKELQRQKDDFLGIASHELKTPVTSIKAYAQIVEMMLKRSGDDKNLELIHKMNNQINRLTNLIADLLDVTKINTGKLAFKPSIFDFDQLVAEVADEIQVTSEQHKIEKKLNSNSLVDLDRDRLSQVISNLITNAIKYSPDAKKIIIQTEVSFNEVQFSVQDFGIGIASDKQEKIFEQFYRVSNTNEYAFPGLGLGLYISVEIIKQMNGRIWVNSEQDQGASFGFALPLANGNQKF